MELDSTEMMKRFVMAGLGISFLAVSNCQEEIAAGKLKAIALAPEPMVRRLGLIYRRDKALSKAALGFIQIILDNMGEHRSAESRNFPSSLRDSIVRTAMLCPECNRSFEGDAGSCPRCGQERGVVKTSTILISSGERQTVYRSVEDVPDR